MNKLLTTLFALLVASATGFAQAQTPAASAPAAAASKPAAAPSSPASLQAKIAMCLGCHNIPGYQASFPEVHKVPMIAGQSAAYIEAALGAYKTGERKHPTMRGIAVSLSDQDMADLAAYYEAQGKGEAAPKTVAAPSAAVAELLKKTNCASCHGENFSTPIDASYPKIAGQHADYLYVALKSYTVDNNPNIGRSNPIMSGMARQYTPAQLKELANYLGSLQGELSTVSQPAFK